MRRKPAIALMLAAALMFGSVSVGATEVSSVSETPTADVETTVTQTPEDEAVVVETDEAEVADSTDTSVPEIQTSVEGTAVQDAKTTTVATVEKTIGPVTVLSDGKAYVSDANGKRITTSGTPIVSGYKYWVQKDGTLGTGWLYLGNWKMYFDPDTYQAKTGMADIKGKRYLFNSDGVMQNFAGTTIINGKKYWFSTDDASLKSGWLKLGSMKLYFDPTTYEGVSGLTKINGKYYMFNSDGVLYSTTGTPIINGKKYWISSDSSLKTGWLYLGKWKMYFDPETCAAKTGMADINGKRYLFNSDGVMQNYAGTTVIDGKKY